MKIRTRARRWITRACHAAAERRQVVTTAAAVVIGGGSSVFACPVCFGAEETSMIDGTRLGIAALLAITLSVQGAFVGFFFYLRKRAKQIADIELEAEWSELQGGASRS
jgi:hypothetical protein